MSDTLCCQTSNGGTLRLHGMEGINDSEQTFQNVCRACLTKDGKTRTIFDLDYKYLKISEMLTAITPQLHINSIDALPKLICVACVEILNIAYKFQEMCIASDNYIRSKLDVDILEQKLTTSKGTSSSCEESSVQTEQFIIIQQSETTLINEDPLQKEDELRSQEYIKMETSDEEINDFDLVRSIDEQIKKGGSVDWPQEEDTNDLTLECSTWRKKNVLFSNDKRTSKAWLYFTDLRDEKARCNFCDHTISYRGGNPYNLTRHLKTKHPHIFNNENFDPSIVTAYSNNHTTSKHETLNPSVPSTSVGNVNFHKTNSLQTAHSSKYSTGKKTERLNRFLVKFISKEFLPFMLVESITFKKLVNELNSYYQLPSRNILSNVILDKYYSIEKDNLQKSLNDADYIALTTDSWTSISNANYITITAHFLNKKTELQSWLLDCQVYSDNLKNYIESVCNAWNICYKIEAITSDNDSNIERAVQLLNWRQIPCFAHKLNNIVQLALKEIETTLNKIRTIVKYFIQNKQAVQKLHDMQLDTKELKLKMDIETQWTSTLEKLQSVIDTRESFTSIKTTDFPEIKSLTDDDWNIITTACDLLSIIRDVTEEMSSENKPTLSQILLVFNALKNECHKFLQENSSLPQTVKNMAELTLEELTKLFKIIDENSIFAECIILDPRFKKHGFANQFSYMEACLKLKQLVTNNSQLQAQEENAAEASVKLDTDKSPPPPPKKSCRLWNDFDREVGETLKNTSPEIIEVDKYLQEPILKRSEDPFKWWHMKKDAYPRLYKLVRKRMCISATSVPSELIFTKAGHLLTQRKCSLSSKEVSKLVFLNYNM